MRKTRDFKCSECEHKEIRLVYDDVYTLECSGCKGESKRQLSAPVGSGNSAHGFLKRTGGFN